MAAKILQDCLARFIRSLLQSEKEELAREGLKEGCQGQQRRTGLLKAGMWEAGSWKGSCGAGNTRGGEA